MAWTVETLNETVDAEAGRTASGHACSIGPHFGVDPLGRAVNVKQPHVRHVRGGLWEIRVKGKAGIARALYITARAQRVVIVRAFVKKTEKTPTNEIDLALQRAKEVKP
jgi:hypothetical protein